MFEKDDAIHSYDNIRREQRHLYLRTILCKIEPRELIERFSILYGEYIRVEFQENPKRYEELYNELLQFDSFHSYVAKK